MSSRRKTGKTPGGHLETADLLDYFEGRGGSGLRNRIESHVAGPCQTCREKLARVAHLLDVASRSGDLDEPPAYLVQRAQALISESPGDSIAERVRELVARVLFDSAHDPMPAFVRRVAPGVRRLRYEIDDSVLEIEIEQAGTAQVTIRGVLDGPDPESAEIIVRAGEDVHRAVPEPSGHLVLTGVPDRNLEIEILWGGQRYRLPDLE